MLFSRNTPPSTRDGICAVLTISKAQTFDIYLGFPQKYGDHGQPDFDFVIQRLQDKLAGWRPSLLSVAGRRILMQSVKKSIPNFVIQGSLLPIRTCKKIGQANRNFIWGSTLDKKKLHLVNYNKATMPKEWWSGFGVSKA